MCNDSCLRAFYRLCRYQHAPSVYREGCCVFCGWLVVGIHLPLVGTKVADLTVPKDELSVGQVRN
jgi:hypothetical protein